MSEVNLEVRIGDLTLKNPVMLASGTVGYGDEISEFVDLSRIGAIITKSVSLEPRIGNPPERITETASGMLNAIGLANIGLERFINEKIPNLEKLSSTVICNIAASSFEEYKTCVEELTNIDSIKAFEINVSCPNVKDGGLSFGNDLSSVRKITSLLRPVSSKPLIIKLSPNTSNIAEFARAVKEEGGDAVSAINTLVGTSFDIYTGKPKIKNITGGLSGPAIKPVALAKVLEISRNVNIPIIGVGGISNWEDAVEFLIAGASAIQIGTANFINPKVSETVIEGLEKFCKSQNINSISELTASYKL
jgi:dihydroorotate dehydrogenase (NAD+) catalytic subunit